MAAKPWFFANTEGVLNRNGIMGFTPSDRLADLVPPPRKHRHRYHGVFTPNHKLRPAVTALAIGNGGKSRDAATGGHAVGGHASRGDATGSGDSSDKPRTHDTSRIAWAKLMARVGEAFPLECPECGGDIGLIAFFAHRSPWGLNSLPAHAQPSARDYQPAPAPANTSPPDQPTGTDRRPTGVNLRSCRPQ
jgi:hypothetical protein